MRPAEISAAARALRSIPVGSFLRYNPATYELELMDAIFHDPAVMDREVQTVMGPKLPTIGVGQKVELAVKMLDTAPALLVLSGGRPLSVMTRSDVLSYLQAVSAYG